MNRATWLQLMLALVIAAVVGAAWWRRRRPSTSRAQSEPRPAVGDPRFLAVIERRNHAIARMDSYRRADGHGAPPYAAADVARCAQILDRFIDALGALPAGVDETVIRSHAQRCVVELNHLDERVEGLIETQEREDLCEIIDAGCAAAGLVGHDDIADEWREW